MGKRGDIMDILELELELDELGLSFYLDDEYQNAWEVSSLIISESNKRNNEKTGLYLQLSYLGHEDDYISYFLIEIIKKPTGFILSDIHRNIIEEQSGETFFKSLEQKVHHCKLRLLFLFPQVEMAIKN